MNDTEQPFTNLLDADELSRLQTALATRFEAFEAELDALPQSIACDRHPEVMAALNREASYDAAKAVYTCQACEDAKLQRRIERRMMEAGIPSDVRHATLENFQTTRQNIKTGEGIKTPAQFVAWAQKFAGGEPRNIMFLGTPGLGKGHLASALASIWIRASRSVQWVTCAQLFTEYHKAYDDRCTERVVQKYARASLLICDEICFRALPADGEQILFEVIDQRHKQGLQTIMLGNKTASDAREWLGSRICDRLRSGGITACYGEWDSMRGKVGDGGEF